MTREEAINWLKAISFVSDHHITEAIDMAIEALKREAERQEMTIRASERHLGLVRCKDCRYFKKIAERSDSGLCHRDLVASAWKENGFCSRGERKGGDAEVNETKSPYMQQSRHDDGRIEVVRCKDCKHSFYDKHYETYNCRKHEYVECFDADDYCSWGERND